MQHESTIFSTIRYIDRENFALDIEIFRNIEVSYYSPRLSAPRAAKLSTKNEKDCKLKEKESAVPGRNSVSLDHNHN